MNIFGIIFFGVFSIGVIALCGAFAYGHYKQKKLLKRARALKQLMYEEYNTPKNVYFAESLKKNKQISIDCEKNSIDVKKDKVDFENFKGNGKEKVSYAREELKQFIRDDIKHLTREELKQVIKNELKQLTIEQLKQLIKDNKNVVDNSDDLDFTK